MILNKARGCKGLTKILLFVKSLLILPGNNEIIHWNEYDKTFPPYPIWFGRSGGAPFCTDPGLDANHKQLGDWDIRDGLVSLPGDISSDTGRAWEGIGWESRIPSDASSWSRYQIYSYSFAARGFISTLKSRSRS